MTNNVSGSACGRFSVKVWLSDGLDLNHGFHEPYPSACLFGLPAWSCLALYWSRESDDSEIGHMCGDVSP